MTPPEIDRRSLPGQTAWQNRVVPNPFPIVRPEGPQGDGAQAWHEVIVDTPDHAASLDGLPHDAAALLFETYASRWKALATRPDAQAVVIFHNEGVQAGASLVHSHSQAVALPRVPPRWERKIARARTLTREASSQPMHPSEGGIRDPHLVAREPFTATLPYASAWPYEIRIQPDAKVPAFSASTPTQRSALASLVQDVLRALRETLGPFPFNLVLDAPSAELERQGLRWSVHIVPRTTVTAGFEIATGLRVNPVAPEVACIELRKLLARRERSA